MYSNENNETFPSDTTAMTSFNLLYPDYVSEGIVFKCPSDNLVTDTENANITAGDAFEKDEHYLEVFKNLSLSCPNACLRSISPLLVIIE